MMNIIDPSISPEILDLKITLWKRFIVWKLGSSLIQCDPSNNELIKLQIEGEILERNFRRKAVEKHFIELSKTTNHHHSFHFRAHWESLFTFC
jgi:hypothetical protein